MALFDFYRLCIDLKMKYNVKLVSTIVKGQDKFLLLFSTWSSLR